MDERRHKGTRRASRPLVLLIDDRDSTTGGFAPKLEARGYHVMEVEDGGRGLQLLQTLRPAALVTRVSRSRQDAWAICRAARAELWAHTPVLLVVDQERVSDETRARARRLHVILLAKTSAPNRVAAAVDILLRKAARRPGRNPRRRADRAPGVS